MIFTKATEYGIRAAVFIAQQSLNGERASLKEISKEIDSPVAFTAKILQQLVKGKVIVSVVGPSGGFEIDKKNLRKISLADIVQAINGNTHENVCVLGLKRCSEVKPCPVHNTYKHIKKDLREMLHNTNLLGMSQSINEGIACLRVN
ncbi:MAG: RrF2 family transcriptional regulator [Bacteroidia bacterium]